MTNQENITQTSENPSLEGVNVEAPTPQDILNHKLALAEAGFHIALDPNEAERAEEMGFEACTEAQAIAEGYDPSGENFSPEELEDALQHGNFKEISHALLDKACVLITAEMRAIRSKKETFFELSDEDKKAFDKLNCAMDELERIQKQILEKTREEQHALILEWGELLNVLNAGDDLSFFWERIQKESEKGRRRKAIEGAVASFELEGVYQTEAEKALDQRFINLEITEEEFLNKGLKLADKEERKALCRQKAMNLL